MNGFQYAVAAWLPIVIFPQTMAPTFRYGFPSTFGLVIAALIAIVAIQFLHVRSTREGKNEHISDGVEDNVESVIGEEHPTDPKDVYARTQAKNLHQAV